MQESDAKPKRGLRGLRGMVGFYMADFETPLGKGIDIFIIALNLLAVGIFVLNTYDVSEANRALLWSLERAVVLIFIIEYLLRLYGAPDRIGQMRDIYSIIDFLAIIPTLILMAIPAGSFVHEIRFIQTLRVLAAFRIFRFLRFISRDHLLFGTIRIEMIDVAQLVMSIIMIFFIYSGLFYFVEHPMNPEVHNFGDAFYFTVVAVSTVGFGDIVPATPEGRLVAIAMIISGIILVPFQAARIFRTWITSEQEKESLICGHCGLDRHDSDALHCKRCGEALEHDGES